MNSLGICAKCGADVWFPQQAYGRFWSDAPFKSGLYHWGCMSEEQRQLVLEAARQEGRAQ